jgi:hypothetical protein
MVRSYTRAQEEAEIFFTKNRSRGHLGEEGVSPSGFQKLKRGGLPSSAWYIKKAPLFKEWDTRQW